MYGQYAVSIERVKYLFLETVTGKFEKMKTKAMVLVIAKMNMKVHFNFLILSTKI